MSAAVNGFYWLVLAVLGTIALVATGIDASSFVWFCLGTSIFYQGISKICEAIEKKQWNNQT
jgi:hypothetical protein